MKIKYLGTAAAEGLPGLFCDCDLCENARKVGGKEIRTRSQSVIDDKLLIDFPADTYLHILRDNLELHKIHNLIITHFHADHFYMPDLLNRGRGYSHLKDNRPFNVYAPDTVVKMIKEGQYKDNFENMEKDDLLYVHEIEPFKSFNVDEYKITPLKADHAYGSTAVFYVIQKGEQSLLYGHDTGYFPEESWDWLKASGICFDYVSLDCTYGLLVKRENHMGIDAVNEVKEDMKKFGLINDKSIVCINHFSHNINSTHEELTEAAEKRGMICSYDGMEVEF